MKQSKAILNSYPETLNSQKNTLNHCSECPTGYMCWMSEHCDSDFYVGDGKQNTGVTFTKGTACGSD